MSAFLVQHETIGVIAAYAFHKGGLQYGVTYENRERFNSLEKVAQVLARKNIDSVNYRYNQSDEPADELYIRECVAAARVADLGKTWKFYKTPDLAKLISSYAYQACEQSDWYESDAFKILTQCREALLSDLPGYEQSRAWG